MLHLLPPDGLMGYPMQNMGLTTWKGTDTLKSDMGVAKIYLSEEELRAQQSGRAVALHLMIARMGRITG
ncbi:hypothetical protein BBC27_02895 [Acidithiobacillus ferrivorans]|uniref:Uncharacterized protein n=2 Tax=Acidithiobacillus ferrivorans TaxID=160808 RepID=A0A1B9BVH9_9PROT|nr:hypothetical protein BBC27_02895 [Acidithiobacillus ferrivorans]